GGLRDREAEVERGYALAHVADVARGTSRAVARSGRRFVEREAGARCVRTRAQGQRKVRAEVLVHAVRAARRRQRVVRLKLETRARLEGGALGDAADLLDDLGEVFAVARAQHEVRGGEIGHDVRRLPAIRDHAVDAHVVAEVL